MSDLRLRLNANFVLRRAKDIILYVKHISIDSHVSDSDIVAARITGLTTSLAMYGTVGASDPLEPPPYLLERLREIQGYTWDESRRPFHSSYNIW
jgi:hypothetical protein